MIHTRFIRNASAAVVAGIAAVASYEHMRELAAAHGQGGLIGALIPISVDGMLAVSAVTMHDDRLSGRRVRPWAAVAFVIGVGASIAANTASAPPHLLDRLISAWPAVALLLVVEVLAYGGQRRTSAVDAVATPDVRRSEAAKRGAQTRARNKAAKASKRRTVKAVDALETAYAMPSAPVSPAG